MQRYWTSWVQPTPDQDYRPLTYPPNEAIIGWWVSGYCNFDEDCNFQAVTICALVQAPSEPDAFHAVRQDWPEIQEWRIFHEVAPDWVPGDRFPLDEDWTQKRLTAAPLDL